MKDFSQSGEQKIILDYFQKPRWEYLIGRVLDIGANDGVTFSNSRMLVQMGWKATLVEPAPIAFRKLLKNYDAELPENASCEHVHKMGGDYSELFLVNAAITPQDGPIDFYDSGTHLHKGDTSLLSTTRPEELARWKRSGEVFTKTTVRGITFETLLKETGVTHFDFITIDCEGVDLEVLRQMDLTALGTRMVCVEVNRNDQRPFDEHCAKHGLKLLHRNYENAIYVK